MTAIADRAPSSDAAAARLWAAMDSEFLEVVAWDQNKRVLTFPQEHALLSWSACPALDCRGWKPVNGALCTNCARRWKNTSGISFEEFLTLPKARKRTAQQPCIVPGCERPRHTRRTGLCASDQARLTRLGITLTEYLALPDLRGREAFGPCEVAACDRDRTGTSPYCFTHYTRWLRAHRRDPGLDEMTWRRTTYAVVHNNFVSLRGLADRVVAELLYGLQQRTKSGTKTSYRNFRPFVDRVRQAQVATLHDYVVPPTSSEVGGQLLTALLKHLYLVTATPETERHKDVWACEVFGHSGTVRFTEITQPWLREAAKVWALEEFHRRRGRVQDLIQFNVKVLERLSTSMRLQRQDRGDIPAELGRADISAHLNRLAFLADQGTIHISVRSKDPYALRLMLTRMRKLSLGRPGQPLHGLAGDFSIREEDVHQAAERSTEGDDLPLDVMRHLCEQLPSLEDRARREIRTAVELLIDTGRRPVEIAALPWDCLTRDGDNKPVLLWNNSKSNREMRRLPIPEATAAIIVAQQARTRAKFPTTPVADLALLPSRVRNPNGTKSLHPGWIGALHRRWVDVLPEVLAPVVVMDGDLAVTRMLPFDKAKINLYSYRHTYAQRHADAGVEPDVLRELMDHKKLSTTQIYYRVGEKRRRAAVDKVATMQFDRHGNRIWREAKALLESEQARRAVGEVAVPYGRCSEPSNVAASGQDCPLRFRCVGCGHYSTDVSYLPDLERHLADLLRYRERLVATVDADEWARNEALPSDEEINRVRRLIDRVKADLDDLTDEDRAEIEEATAVVRRNRTRITSLGMPRIRQPLPDIRPERTA
ncbi:site-specific integrase [Amycolatopsis sp. WAC 01375]|uniref:tyrosine-type recombinase/integrase n=1 Tax=Amycolatopsis sp. WAC 01375 TaxID=2203194 RepID=UPI0018F71BEA|nr:site-specific integrase [Amycolatopsis sp. WAC 01375]